MKAKENVIVLLGICFSIMGYVMEKYVFRPWRDRRREKRRERKINQRVARDVETARQNFRALRNGRTARRAR